MKDTTPSSLCNENMNLQYTDKNHTEDMLYTKTTKDTGDNDEIKEWESELDIDETVMTMTRHHDGQNSYHLEE